MQRRGFTLLELMISMGILTIVGALGIVAIMASTTAANVARAKTGVQQNVRDVMNALVAEIQLTAKEADDSLDPPLEPLQIVENPVPTSPIEVVFQVPVDDTGENWTEPIHFRYINEDVNENALLDGDEDADGDGALTRRILRIEDTNGDGDTDDSGESEIVAAANDLSDVQFELDENRLTITLTASRMIGLQRRELVTVSQTNEVYFLN